VLNFFTLLETLRLGPRLQAGRKFRAPENDLNGGQRDRIAQLDLVSLRATVALTRRMRA
jgi:hypothetical protein